MACKNCEEKRKQLRDAIMHGRMAEAMDTTIEGLRTMIGFDAGADHRKDAAESDGTDAGKNATKTANKDK